MTIGRENQHNARNKHKIQYKEKWNKIERSLSLYCYKSKFPLHLECSQMIFVRLDIRNTKIFPNANITNFFKNSTTKLLENTKILISNDCKLLFRNKNSRFLEQGHKYLGCFVHFPRIVCKKNPRSNNECIKKRNDRRSFWNETDSEGNKFYRVNCNA